LGLTSGNTIYLNQDAAGYGWFVDPTLGLDEAFGPANSSGQSSAIDPQAQGRMDLLTVVEHELGHIAGLSDLSSSVDDLMSSRLSTGIRRTVTINDVDAIFAEYSGVN
jgi:hypothetical protein